jgi:TusA-related sulfurtransferase
MTMSTVFDQTLDLRGIQCPMPLVEGSKAIKALSPGETLKVVAHLPGSMAIQGLVANVKNVEQVEQETTSDNGADLYVHYLRRTK